MLAGAFIYPKIKNFTFFIFKRYTGFPLLYDYFLKITCYYKKSISTCHYFPCKKRFTTACCLWNYPIVTISWPYFPPHNMAESNVSPLLKIPHCSLPWESGPFAVPMWQTILPDLQRIKGLVGYYPTNSLIRVRLSKAPIFNLSLFFFIFFYIYLNIYYNI